MDKTEKTALATGASNTPVKFFQRQISILEEICNRLWVGLLRTFEQFEVLVFLPKAIGDNRFVGVVLVFYVFRQANLVEHLFTASLVFIQEFLRFYRSDSEWRLWVKSPTVA